LPTGHVIYPPTGCVTVNGNGRSLFKQPLWRRRIDDHVREA
jgi:hypothetical protein